MVELEQSYRLCERITRSRARNFYFSFLTLPRAKRRAMCAIYAFMRECDDIADDASVVDRNSALLAWRGVLLRLAQGDTSAHPSLPAFLDTVLKYRIPLRYFEEVINGAEMDLVPRRYATFDDLYAYCYRVASVVGLTCLHVFGATSERALSIGERCGIAFQLTNILRDVREDAEEGRVYLPMEDLRRFGCSEEDLHSTRMAPHLLPLLELEAERAQQYYVESLDLIAMADPDSRGSLSAMICIYHRLLSRIRDRGCDVFSRRVSVPVLHKLALAFLCWIWPVKVAVREVVERRS